MSESGNTPSERYLAKLCRRSFLSLWSFANPYTDEGRRSGKGAGQELCDLLVVFGNNVITFSDKFVRYDLSQPIEVAWSRWYRHAIAKSAQQLAGAEHWLRRYPGRVYVDRHCSTPLPVVIPRDSDIRIHRVAVAGGAYQPCQDFFGGNSLGSLMINSDIQGDQHKGSPFCVGNVAPEKGFVHVFDEFSLAAVFNEIDTISDFTSYLSRRERFLTAGKPSVLACGEEQLLAFYLKTVNDVGEHDFLIPTGKHAECGNVFFDETHWDHLRSHPQYRAKKEADGVSYIWDNLIEHFVSRGGFVDYPESATVDAQKDLERCVREMASEDRFRRRQLGEAFENLLATVGVGESRVRVVYATATCDNLYVFLVVSPQAGESYDDYRRRRISGLHGYCNVAKLQSPHSRYVIGIALEPKGSDGGSEDLIVIDTSRWTPEMESAARELQLREGLLLDTNVTRRKTSINEYPELPRTEVDPVSAARRRSDDRKTKRNLQKRSRKRNRNK